MAFFGRRKKRNEPPTPPPPPSGGETPPRPAEVQPAGPVDEDGIDLVTMIAAIQAAAPSAAEAPADLVLLRAQWGDLCRDGHTVRPSAEAFAPLSADDAALRRASLLMSALLSQPHAARWVSDGAYGRNADGHLHCSVVLPATRLDLLTPQLVAESNLRAEELARAFAASLGVGIQGEDEATSEATLRRLDYRRLLAGADRAKAKAADKMDYLRELYAAQEDARPRGKW